MTSKARSNAKPAAPRTAPAAAAAKSQVSAVRLRSSAETAFRSHARTRSTRRRPTRTCSPRPSTVWSSRFNLQGEKLGLVVGGAVLKHSRDFNLIRESVLGSALSPYTPAFDLQQACGTGLQSIIAVGDAIAAGRIDAGIGGGVGHHVRRPDRRQRSKLREFLLSLNRAKSTGDRIKLLGNVRAGMLGIEIPRNGEPRTGMSMGDHAAITAKEFGIRREDQDELAAASHQNMAAAYDRGFFDDLVTPFLGLTRDDNLRPGSTVEKLSTLKPVFGTKLGDATMTAGNSTPLTDGASAVAAVHRRVGSRAQSSGSGAPRRFRNRCRRLRPRQRRVAHGSHVRDSAFAGPQRSDLAGLRLLRDPRSVRFGGAGNAAGVRVRRVLQGTPRPRRRIGIDRPKQAQCQRIVAWLQVTRSRQPADVSWLPSQRCSRRRVRAAA